jgi:tripartite-type tricarboxylate transporter receptor subunit TctC
MTDRRRMILAAAGSVALAASGFATRALAQAAPASGKLVRVMNGFPPGGSADVVTRMITDKLRAGYAPTAIVENRPGGGGRTVLEHARGGDADGTAIVLTPTAMLTIFPHVYRNLGYDTFRDFTAVGSAATFVTAITAGSALPANVKTLPDLVEWAKTLPQGASYGSPGAGTSLHFVGTMLSRRAGGKMTHVPYKGAAPMMQDLLGGQIPIGMAPIGDAVPYARGGKLRVLATTGTRRSKFLPDVPTAIEAGYPEVVAEDYFALFVPAKTPADLVEKLGAAVREALKSPELQDRLGQLGLEVRASTPAEMNDIVRAQYNAWGPIVKASGFTADE